MCVCVCVRMYECVCLPFFLSLGALTFPYIGYKTESLLKKIMLLILFFLFFAKENTWDHLMGAISYYSYLSSASFYFKHIFQNQF